MFASTEVGKASVRNESNKWLDDFGPHSPPASILRENGLSVSIYVMTRKIAIYACIG